MDYFNKTKEIIQRNATLCTELSDHIWDLAETKFHEFHSADYYCKVLHDHGFKVERGIGSLPTAFKGSYGTNGPTIGYLGEFDALPGLGQQAGVSTKTALQNGNTNGHGCGHQLLGAGAFAAALAVKEQIESGAITGTVIFYGCPAEEGGSGKAWMVREHCFDESDVLLTWHPGTYNMVIPEIWLASIQAVFTFTGVSAHAAACPHLGRSALDAVELMNVGVNFLREHVTPDVRMHYAITDAGGNFANIVQPKASVLYQLRAEKMSEANDVYERVQRIAKGAALMTDTTVEVKFDRCCSNVRLIRSLDEVVYSNLLKAGPVPVNEKDLAFAKEIRGTFSQNILGTDERELRKSYGKDGAPVADRLHSQDIVTEIYPLESVMNNCAGSTDVGDVSQVKPVSQIMVSCYAKDTPGHSWQIVAQGKEALAHKALLHVGLVLGSTGAQLLADTALMNKIKNEFSESYAAEPYICPIPSDAKPPIQTF